MSPGRVMKASKARTPIERIHLHMHVLLTMTKRAGKFTPCDRVEVVQSTIREHSVNSFSTRPLSLSESSAQWNATAELMQSA